MAMPGEYSYSINKRRLLLQRQEETARNRCVDAKTCGFEYRIDEAMLQIQ